MLAPHTQPKIRPEHLDRQALIYVRQSTLAQVRHHTASTARQYDLVQRALQLGWAPDQVLTLDQDQGHSGASAQGRDGFQWLVAEVGLGHAGAVLSLDASRLARSCSDWYRLLEICALTDTLVIDEDSVYDPGQYNDRLLLGFQGTMSEAELHWLRQRLLGGKLEKARQGQLRFRLPTGLVYDPSGQVGLDPDEQVQHAVRLVFDLFETTGSALAVVQHFGTHQLLFPTRLWGGPRDYGTGESFKASAAERLLSQVRAIPVDNYYRPHFLYRVFRHFCLGGAESAFVVISRTPYFFILSSLR